MRATRGCVLSGTIDRQKTSATTNKAYRITTENIQQSDDRVQTEDRRWMTKIQTEVLNEVPHTNIAFFGFICRGVAICNCYSDVVDFDHYLQIQRKSTHAMTSDRPQYSRHSAVLIQSD
jgi:hypothetical protein